MEMLQIYPFGSLALATATQIISLPTRTGVTGPLQVKNYFSLFNKLAKQLKKENKMNGLVISFNKFNEKDIRDISLKM